jgi:hypothetical protein
MLKKFGFRMSFLTKEKSIRFLERVGKVLVHQRRLKLPAVKVERRSSTERTFMERAERAERADRADRAEDLGMILMIVKILSGRN